MVENILPEVYLRTEVGNRGGAYAKIRLNNLLFDI